MTSRSPGASHRWAAWCLIAGGAAAGGLWLVFTVSHGPTSYNEDRAILGLGMHGWGMLLGVVPNALLLAGLVGLRASLLAAAGRAAGIGYIVAVGGLLASAMVDLAVRALGPPLLVPVQAIGLVLLGAAPGSTARARHPRAVARVILAIGILLIAAFAIALIPLDISDRFGGYRIYGAVAHLATGVGWVLAGVVALRAPAARAAV
jgi:hypothetical protein